MYRQPETLCERSELFCPTINFDLLLLKPSYALKGSALTISLLTNFSRWDAEGDGKRLAECETVHCYRKGSAQERMVGKRERKEAGERRERSEIAVIIKGSDNKCDNKVLNKENPPERLVNLF